MLRLGHAGIRSNAGAGGPGSTATRISLIVVLVLLLFGARSIASYAIEIAWWKELGQFRTWLSMLYYSFAPLAAATLAAFGVLWLAHARALKFAGTGLGEHRLYSRISTLALLILGYLVSAASIDTWTVVRFAGSRGLPAATTVWRDSVFDKPLSFYLFDLPFYGMLRGWVLALAIFSILLYWIAARAWQLRYKFPELKDARELDPTFFRLEGGLESRFLRGAAVVLLAALAVRFFLGRYEMVYNEHGTFLVGVDYVDQYIGLPLQWLVVFACLAAAVLVWMGRWLMAAFMALALVVSFVVPRRGLGAVRAAQRDLPRTALHPDPHSCHAQRLRHRAARTGGGVQDASRRPPRRGAQQAHAR